MLQPKLRLDLTSTYVDFFRKWKGAEISATFFHRSSSGDLALVWGGDRALASSDEGRTWYESFAFSTWPESLGILHVGTELAAVVYEADRNVFLTRSSDGGMKWSTPDPISRLKKSKANPRLDGPYVMNDRILLTAKGHIIIPVDYLLGREGPDPDQIGTIVSRDGGHTWQSGSVFGPPPPLPDRPEGFGEPAVVELADGMFWMVFRSRFGHLWQALSSDGLIWGSPTPTGLASPLSAVNAKRIPGSDDVVLVWNNAVPGVSRDFSDCPSLWRPRSPLVFSVSHDGCRRWSSPVIIERGTGIYPSIHFSDTQMFVLYRSNPDPAVRSGADYGLTLVAYEKRSVLNLPAWDAHTIAPYIADGRAAPWLLETAAGEVPEAGEDT